MKAVIFAAAAVFAIGAGAALAQGGPAKERSSIMRTMQDDGFNPLRAMTQGKLPYDQAAVEKSYTIIQSGLEKSTGLWPANSPSSPEGRFASSPKIWENKADFEAKLASAKKIVAATRSQAVSGPDGLKAALPQVADACGACHETYRVRQR